MFVRALNILGKVLRGAFAVFVIAELSLQLTAAVNSAFRKIYNVNLSQKGRALTILCVGDSFTYGVGAGVSLSYPDQLEEIIRQNYPLLNARVVNCGRPGANSSMVASNLESYINSFRPDIILVCVGRNDDWNLEGVERATLDSRALGRKGLLIVKIDSLIAHLRTYKLLRYLISRQHLRVSPFDKSANVRKNDVADASKEESADLNSSVSQAAELIEAKDFTRAVKKLELISGPALATRDPGLISQIGFLYLNMDEYQMAMGFFDTSLRYDPELANAYQGKGQLYFSLGDYDVALENFNKAAALCKPGYQGINWIYRNIGTILLQKGDREAGLGALKKAFQYDRDINSTIVFLAQYFDAEALIKIVNELMDSDQVNPRNSFYRAYFNMLEQNSKHSIPSVHKDMVDKIIKYNLSRMFRTARRSAVEMYYVNYPSSGYPPDGTAEYFLNKFWPGHLIDIKSTFAPLWAGREKAKYFVPDNHCTAKGYALMANVIFEFMERQRLLPGKR